MSIFIATFIIIAVAVLGMAIGVIMGKPAIKGSCGGLNQVGLSGSCSGACSSEEKDICAKRKAELDKQNNE
ncbi:MAG: (Na+)-NQR maturation NqrM [Gammaproteobacteria bacterium]|nr:(Na+)-NQR maturation NqrM [Gammaproteobacteria bacterium]